MLVTRVIGRRMRLFAGGLMLLGYSSGQATSPALEIRTLAEVATKAVDDGIELVHLSPAERVAPGDLVFYTVEIRNLGGSDAVAPTVTQPVPEHMAYIADSATGPGAEITYSIDGGSSFDRPERLKAQGPDGKEYLAKASNYTHIRWKFKNILKSKSVAYARFRAVVK
jgi:uncharacterized repeat protein (TIGR01451 family)